MEQFIRYVVVLATAATVSFPVAPARHRASTPPPATKAPVYTADQIEAYLGDDGIAYIRPGLKLTIVSVTNVVPGKKPVVEFTLTDSLDQPLDRLGKVTPGPIAPAFVLGVWDPSTRYYHSLTTRTRNGVTAPNVDSGGTFTDLEVGHGTYTFATAMPANLDLTKTFTIGGQAKRTLTDIIGKDYFADNAFKDFRPDGLTPVAPAWNNMAVANSCNKCHDPLALHGGNRRDIHLCVMCHTNENLEAGTGQSFSARVFYHKIHMGSSLPSVKNGGTFAQGGIDFSTVVFPQDIRNCTTCHDPKAAEADVWNTRPTREACGSCHDDVNFATGANHEGGVQADDSKCTRCHVADSGDEFDASVKGAHVNPLKSKQLKGLTVTIVSVTNTAPGQKPTVTFAIKNGDGSAVDGTKLATFAPILAGPTSSYTTFWRESGLATTKTPGTFDAAKGTTSYTCQNAIPANATGTWTISLDASRTVTLKRADQKADISVREAAFNPVSYFAVNGGTATPRRTAVDIANCNVCHETLALHGGNRRNTQECVICHNPTNIDGAGRPASTGPPESISFQRHIHRIHTGENLTQQWTIYGGSATPSNFNDVRFPGDRRDCQKCHVAGAYTLPLASGIDSVPTLRDYFSPQGPATAACLGCHDNSDAAAHAYLNSTTFGKGTLSEACATCHGVGKDWDVAKVHAR
ncbi:MAG TPA: OmcA/MtrC family decaheme c-type cytochrome [Thermoanaerobaculia bacterium]|nr:OmcA/MtrC family decaheme c-type cytochrome [Thermoanaerobaculia bacterium]